MWFANIFCYSIGCLFISLTVSFTLQKLFSLMLSQLFLSLLLLLVLLASCQKIFAQVKAKKCILYILFY